MKNEDLFLFRSMYLKFHVLKRKINLSKIQGIYQSMSPLTSILLSVSLYSLVSSISSFGWISSVWSISFWQMGL